MGRGGEKVGRGRAYCFSPELEPLGALAFSGSLSADDENHISGKLVKM